MMHVRMVTKTYRKLTYFDNKQGYARLINKKCLWKIACLIHSCPFEPNGSNQEGVYWTKICQRLNTECCCSTRVRWWLGTPGETWWAVWHVSYSAGHRWSTTSTSGCQALPYVSLTPFHHACPSGCSLTTIYLATGAYWCSWPCSCSASHSLRSLLPSYSSGLSWW